MATPYEEFLKINNPIGFDARPSGGGSLADLQRRRFEQGTGQQSSTQLIFDTSHTSDRRVRGGSTARFNRNTGFSRTAGISGGGGNANVARIDLDPFRRAEISSMERLLNLQFQGVRTELEGTIAQTKLTRDYDIAKILRDLRYSSEGNQANALQRGILDSGIFLGNQARIEGEADEAQAQTINQAAASIGALQSQISLLGAQKAANIASQRAQIERAYAMARLAG